MNKQPPKYLLRFLRWFCHPDYVEDIEGDLLERFAQRPSKWLCALEVMKLMKPEIVKSLTTQHKTFNPMISHYLKIAVRHLLKSKKYALLHYMGLTIGLATSFVLFSHIDFFLTYDQYHTKRGQVFEVYQAEVKNEEVLKPRKRSYFGFGPFAKETFPEVTGMSRFLTTIESLVVHEKEDGTILKFNERGIAEADPDFLNMFTLDFQRGNPYHALDEPNSVILTESLSHKYFEDQNPMGKAITTTAPWGAQYQLKVTGVVSDLPKNSTIQFSMLKSLYQKNVEVDENWDVAGYRNYLLIEDPRAVASLAQKISMELNELPPVKAKQRSFRVSLTPLSENELSVTQKLLAVVGFLILLATWINYANLSAAKSLERTKEVGVRKINGSNKTQVIAEFAMEGALLHGLALLTAAVLIWVLYPFCMQLTDGQLTSLEGLSISLMLSILGVFLVGSAMASIYPAMALLKVNPLLLLKNGFLPNGRRKLTSQSLLVAQFTVSIILIIGFSLIYHQMKYIQDRDLGYQVNSTLIIKPSKDLWDGKMERFNTFKNKLRELSPIHTVCSSTAIPGHGGNGYSMVNLLGSTQKHPITFIGVDARYVDGMGMQLVHGSGFETSQFKKNRRSVVINESAAELLGFGKDDRIIGQKIESSRNETVMEVIGVIKDHHHGDLKEPIGPLMLNFNPFRGHVFVKLHDASYADHASLQGSIAHIEGVWHGTYTHQVFDFQFLDDAFERQYRKEITFRRVFTVFTMISIVITCLGLVGMSMLTAQKKQKEVGIRKTLGARVLDILILFSKGFVIQMLMATLVGWPLAYYFMSQWLQYFSYRIDLNAWMFLWPIAALFGLSLLTIILQTLKAANANPVKALRDE